MGYQFNLFIALPEILLGVFADDEFLKVMPFFSRSVIVSLSDYFI